MEHRTQTTRDLMLRAITILLIFTVGCVYANTLRAGHVWGDDFAMYIMEARNICLGHSPYATAYLYNPHAASVGPPSYPPMFPILLSPLFALWGLNLVPMKLLEVLVFCLALWLQFSLIARCTSSATALAVTAAVAACPYYWDFKDNIVSDFPFFLSSSAALLLIVVNEDSGWKRWPLAVAAAVSVYVAFETRTIGFALLPAFFAPFARWQRPARNDIVAVCCAASLILLHQVTFQTKGSYADQLHGLWKAIPMNVAGHFWNLRRLMFGFSNTTIGLLFASTFVLLSATGFVQTWKRGARGTELFFVTYCVVVVTWPSDNDARFLIPVLPLGLMYATLPLGCLSNRLRYVTMATLAGVLLFGYVERYSHLTLSPIADGISDRYFLDMCRFAKERTPPTTVFIFSKPRLFALLTGRRSAAYHEPTNPDELWRYFATIGARYVLLNTAFDTDRQYLQQVLTQYAQRCRERCASGTYHLYEIDPTSATTAHVSRIAAQPSPEVL